MRHFLKNHLFCLKEHTSVFFLWFHRGEEDLLFQQQRDDSPLLSQRCREPDQTGWAGGTAPETASLSWSPPDTVLSRPLQHTHTDVTQKLIQDVETTHVYVIMLPCVTRCIILCLHVSPTVCNCASSVLSFTYNGSRLSQDKLIT